MTQATSTHLQPSSTAGTYMCENSYIHKASVGVLRVNGWYPEGQLEGLLMGNEPPQCQQQATGMTGVVVPFENTLSGCCFCCHHNL